MSFFIFQFGFAKNIYHVIVMNALIGFSVGKSCLIFDVKLINYLLVEIINDYLVSDRHGGLHNNASHGLLGRPEICASIRHGLCYC